MSCLLKNFLNRFIQRSIIFIGILVALSNLGVEVSALLALLGGGAFILGFALQDTLGNFASGVMLILYRPFDVHDIVEVGGIHGKVDKVSLVNTTIRTFDNKIVIVPNKQVWGQIITNSTASKIRRVDMVFGISYSDDIDQAQSILQQLVSDHSLIREEPEPIIELHTLGESSVDFVCRPWCKTEDYWRVYWDITKQVKKAFDSSGVSIPFPQRDVHIYQDSPVIETTTPPVST
jgi:small conductance mechanosensitive channel